MWLRYRFNKYGKDIEVENMLNNKKKVDNKIKGSLNARSDAYVPDVYREKLNEILQDDSSKNIAVTAPYDSGKTTLLKSYFRERENQYNWYVKFFNKIVYLINKCKKHLFFRPNLLSSIKDYEFINIPNFLEVQDQKTDNNTEIQLEKSIIEQLLYKANSRKYPDSNLGRLKIHNLSSIIVNFISVFFIIMYLIRIFVPNKSLKWWNDLAFWNSRVFQLISVIFVLIGSWKIFYWLIHTISNMKVRATTSAGPLEITGETESKAYQVNLFNYYGDELQYYFKKNNIRIVIFEDLDRFNSPAIFQKLRELNNNLNKSGNKIIFIYSLKDRIFSIKDSATTSAALKAKFFDQVIPIFPIHSYRDARKVFINEKNQYPLLTNKVETENNYYFEERDKELKEKERIDFKINDKYLVGLGLYIFDTREIKNIISETNFYASELPLKLLKNKNAINKLLAMIVYKNEFPKDFDDLANGRQTKLEQFFKDIGNFRIEWINKKREDNNKEIEKINKKIWELQGKITPDLFVLMRIRFQQIFDNINSSSIEVSNNYYSRDDDNEEIQRFWKQALDNDLKYTPRYSRSEYQIDVLSKGEKELFSDYLNNHEITINHCIKKLADSKDKLQESNETIQTNILKKSAQEILDIYLDPKNKNLISTDKEGMKFIKDHSVLVYLVRQGLIDFDFADYISPDPYSLTNIDENFIRLVVSHQSIDFENYQLVQPDRVIHELDILDNSVSTYRYALSPNMLVTLAKMKDGEYVRAIIDEAHGKKYYKFILNTLNLLDSKENLNIVENLLKVWPDYYKESFNLSNEGSFQANLSSVSLSLLQSGKIPQLFLKLKTQQIFDNKVFKREFMLLKITQIQKVLDQGTYLYADLSFVDNKSILIKMVIRQWYEQNTINFNIIFEKLTNSDFTELINQKNDLKLSDDYIKQEIWNFYQKQNAAKYSDILGLANFIDKQNDVDSYRNNLVILYINLNEKFDNEQKSNIIDKIHLIDLINNKKLQEKQIKKLLMSDKLVYSLKLLKGISDNYPQEEITYVLKMESVDNLNEIFKNTTWAVTMNQLITSNYKKQLVKEIDDSKKEFTEENCSDESLEILIQNTQNVDTIKHIMTFENLSDKVKAKIIEKIFSDQNFKSKFSTMEISKLVFDDNHYIDTWIEDIDGSHEISTPDLREKYSRQLHLLFDNIPQIFKKKATEKFVLRIKFKDWFN